MKKFHKRFLISLLCVFIIGTVGLFAMNAFYSYEAFEKATSAYANEYSKTKSMYLENFFEGRIDNILVLSEMDYTKELFEKEKEIDKESIFSESKNKIKVISKEIENYLIKNPDLTLEDLKNNVEFKKISVEEVGSSGYSALYEKNSEILISHPDKDLENHKITANIVSLEFFEMMEKIDSGENDIYGKYTFFSEGESFEKFAYFYEIPVKTKDDKSLVLVSTIGNDDYEVIKNFDNDFYVFLKEIKNNKIYEDLIFIENDGSVIFSLEGNNLNLYNANLENSFSDAFEISSLNNETIIYGPYYEKINPNELLFLSISPIFEEGERLGFIAILFPAKKLYERVFSEEIFIDKKEFLLNEDYLLVSPLSNNDDSVLVQEIYTENSQNCFSNRKNQNFVTSFLDYRGEKSMGSSYYIESSGLCFLVEFSREDLDESAVNFLIKDRVPFFVFFAVLLVLSVIIGNYIGKKYKFYKSKKKKKKYLFFKDVSLFRFILVELIFIVIYIFILNFYFSGVFLSTIKNNLPDIASIFILGILLKKSYKIYLPYRKFYFWGILILLVEKIVEIFMQQFEFFRGVGLLINIWFFIIIFLFIGIIFLVKSLEGILKKWN